MRSTQNFIGNLTSKLNEELKILDERKVVDFRTVPSNLNDNNYIYRIILLHLDNFNLTQLKENLKSVQVFYDSMENHLIISLKINHPRINYFTFYPDLKSLIHNINFMDYISLISRKNKLDILNPDLKINKSTNDSTKIEKVSRILEFEFQNVLRVYQNYDRIINYISMVFGDSLGYNPDRIYN